MEILRNTITEFSEEQLTNATKAIKIPQRVSGYYARKKKAQKR